MDLCFGRYHFIENTETAFKMSTYALASVAQLVAVLPSKWKGYRYNSQSGHMPRLWVQSLVRACTKGNQEMFLSHIVSLSLSLSLSLILPPSFPLSLKSIGMSLGEE